MERMNGPSLISDEVVHAKTGKSSAEWHSILDAWGSRRKGNTLAARHLTQSYGLSPRWAQKVTIRYEWGRDLRTRSTGIGNRLSFGMDSSSLRFSERQLGRCTPPTHSSLTTLISPSILPSLMVRTPTVAGTPQEA